MRNTSAPYKEEGPLSRKGHEYVLPGGVRPAMDGPPIVCLCGSTRFMDLFHDAATAETLKGKIVLTVSDLHTSSRSEKPSEVAPETKAFLDVLHLAKIDLASEILVLDGPGPDERPYVGESTRREIEYARFRGKRVRFWSDER